MLKNKIKKCKEASKMIKKLVFDVVYKTQSHHIGSILSCLDVLTVLYFSALNIDPNDPDKKERDIFILSKGHAALAQYAVLSIRGFFPKEILDNFGKDDTKIGTHPDKDCLLGIEISTGSLGHGLSISAGAALAAKKDDLPNKIFVLLSDGECNEGAVWEATMFAAHNKLDNLVAIIDKNNLQAFGTTAEVLNTNSLAEKFKSFGWLVKEVDGHNIADIVKALDQLPTGKGKPVVVIANTIKGKGIASLENKLESHYSSLNKEQYQKAIEQL
jgi:transketolase